ncbi:hypothetical protein [Mycobacterium sp. DL592]|uniref:hypothetical protein n=1 Tax=Mycobacterium sp. DL592 TaxID=2675524 RepID=UPI00142445A1|nr:hypothetical protein [Mycobacterium sp. DL592]
MDTKIARIESGAQVGTAFAWGRAFAADVSDAEAAESGWAAGMLAVRALRPVASEATRVCADVAAAPAEAAAARGPLVAAGLGAVAPWRAWRPEPPVAPDLGEEALLLDESLPPEGVSARAMPTPCGAASASPATTAAAPSRVVIQGAP